MADTAMYRAKSEGRSRFAFYEEPMNVESKRRSLLDGELRNALVRQELVLHYQPQIDLRTGALCGVEALVRWQHPTRGLLFPGDFIDYAEEIGLIPEIGTWVMTEACRQYMLWAQEGVRVPRVSVNVSNGQLPRSNFVPSVRQLLEASRIPPEALEIEVTESMLVDGGKAAMEALNRIAEAGVLIAIDDFGTGYSSFSYLKTMPARVLKLDMSFLVDAREDNDAGKIVAAIINMAHALQKEVVAEGIEHVDQLKLLKSLNCERGQGYLFGKAVTADQISRNFRKVSGVVLASLAAGDPSPLALAGAVAAPVPAPAPASSSAGSPPASAASAAGPAPAQDPPPAAARPRVTDLADMALVATAPVLPTHGRLGGAPIPARLPLQQDNPHDSPGGPITVPIQNTVPLDLLSVPTMPLAFDRVADELNGIDPADELSAADLNLLADLPNTWPLPVDTVPPSQNQSYEVLRMEGDKPLKGGLQLSVRDSAHN